MQSAGRLNMLRSVGLGFGNAAIHVRRALDRRRAEQSGHPRERPPVFPFDFHLLALELWCFMVGTGSKHA